MNGKLKASLIEVGLSVNYGEVLVTSVTLLKQLKRTTTNKAKKMKENSI